MASNAVGSAAPADLPVPDHCVADFCIIPIGTPTPSVSQHIAEVQRIIKRSGLEYSMHSAGTTVQGPWQAVHNLIGHCHLILHQEHNVQRIQSDIRVGTRTDKKQHFNDKVTAVEKLLAADEP